MSLDGFETLVGGSVRDRYGRKELVVATKHQPVLQVRGYEPADADGREEVILVRGDGTKLDTPVGWLGINGNDNSTSGFSGNINTFLNQGIVWARHSQQLGQANDGESGIPLIQDLANGVPLGFKYIVTILPSTYGGGLYPTTTPTIAAYANGFVAQVQAVEAAFPGQGILYEIDNEPWNFFSPPATASQYGQVVSAVLIAAQAAGLDLSRIFPMAQNSAWITTVNAVSLPAPFNGRLGTLIGGWSFHPYGPPPPSAVNGGSSGIAALPIMRDAISTNGTVAAANNVIVSEVGFQDQTISNTAAGGTTNANVAGQAATWLTALLAQAIDYHAAGWLRVLCLYSRTAGNYALVVVNSGVTTVPTPQGTALLNFQTQPSPAPGTPALAIQTPGLWVPSDDFAIAVTMDPAIAASSAGIALNRISAYRLRVDRSDFASKFIMYCQTAGTTLTSGQNFVGLYQMQANNTWAQAAISADQTANWGSTGLKTISFTGGSNLVPGWYWVLFVANGASGPGFAGSNTVNVLNFSSFGVAPQRAMSTSATGFTSLPSTVNLTSGYNNATAVPFVAIA